MSKDELIEYIIRTSQVIKEEKIPELIDYFRKKQERIEYLERSNNRREDTILEQRQEISDLEDNWNKLKERVKNSIKYWEEQEKKWVELGIVKVGGEANTKLTFRMILDIMQELEGSE